MGLNIMESLTALSKNDLPDLLIIAIGEIRSLIEQGFSISDAFGRYKHTFGNIAVKFLALAEKTGNLAESASNIIRFLELNNKASRYIKQALYYPLFSVFMAFVTVFCCGAVLVPQLSNMYKDLNLEYGFFTSTVLFVFSTDWVKFLEGLSLLVVIFCTTITVMALKRKYLLSKFASKIPICGRIINSINLWKFSLTLSSALEAKIASLEALQIAVSSIKNTYWRDCLEKSCLMVHEGYKISSSFNKCCSFMPRLFLLAIEIGEENNTLGKSLGTFSEMIYNQIELYIKSLSSKLSIFLTIFTGLVLLIVIMGLFLPIYSNLINISDI
ncbi:MAG: type II secretion system F family protein [Holosporales bacterium]|jgi:type II secretory pathway component PulF|nr:type II secretion system F family protein [Holosporales bacterium]